MKRSSDWFIFKDDQILLRHSADGYSLPHGLEPPIPLGEVFEGHFHDGTTAPIARVEPLDPPEPYRFVGLRASWDDLPVDLYRKAGEARQLAHWDAHSRYCPACGTPMERKGPIFKRCPRCGYELYPPIATAIIVLIRRGEKILLVRSRDFRKNFYGLVAGFLEVGETLEECVRREVREETSLEITNLRYFDSQPWPYPSGLMVGFVADYLAGEVRLQDEELCAGAFFDRAHLPELPQKLSIARRLIDWWLSQAEGE